MIPTLTKNKTVFIFSIASFLHDVGSDMVFSVWPFFVTQALGANMTVLGIIDGVGDGVVSISQAVSGYISDRVRKRKVFIWIGYLLGGVSRIGYSLSPTWQWLIPFRMLDRSGKLRGSPRDAMVSEASTRANRGQNFGVLRAMDNFGAVSGILIAFFFLGYLGYRNLFLLASIPSIVAVLLVYIFISEMKPTHTTIYKGFHFRDFDGNLKLFTLLNALFTLGAFSYSFLLVYAKSVGFSITVTPVLYLLFTVIAAITSLPFGKLSDKIGRKSVLYVSFLCWGLVPIFFILFQGIPAVIVGFIFYGLHKGALDPVQKTFVAELAPADFIASTLGGFQMIVGLVSLPASFIAGLLWDKNGIHAPFYFSLFLTLVATILLVFVKETRREASLSKPS